MDPLEAQALISRPTNPAKHNHPCQSPTNKKNLDPLSLLLQPFQWLHMLSSHLNPSFVIGVALVYGLGQGFSGSLFKVVTDYYWKDVQKVQPSEVQLYMGFYYIPWVMKPVWGLLTDVFPVRGYRRKPYFVMAGVLGGVSALMVALLGDLPVVVALICLIGLTAGMAIADVAIDACIATNSIECRELAPDMQSLCWFCSSAGALVGYSTSGVLVHHLGAQAALGILAVPPASLIVLGFLIHESKPSSTLHPQKKKKKEPLEGLGVAVTSMCKSIKCPQVWKPSLYMFLSLALSISTHEGQFYWYTDPKAGPAFSQEFVGIIYAIGAMASMVGLVIYHKTLKDYPFRHIMFFAQLLYGVSGMLDLIFVLRWNLALGIPDYFFIVAEECVLKIITRIRWMPMMLLSTRLCPSGIEGTFFALLTCIDSLASLSSKWGGGIVMHLLNVSRTDFRNLWLAILIRNVMRFSALGFIFLVPKATYSEDLIPLDILKNNSAANVDDVEDGDEEMLQRVLKNAV
ncbi:Major facilitator superfamily protein [Tripterygium wilfordii]|uniref:Major facilitator superfamily protein n=1 Tax=Tripterygium wilfordii TaxID=458696 RepID=A0A7J7BWK4_TRIWF|nr:probable folate-biopterin transporter 6 [Tripterygium wilfordii]KAF5726280.1 Major facilitator superfamily protein [Tripterygium wilfordii]